MQCSVEKLLGAYPKLRIYISLPVYRFWTDNGTEYAETYLNRIGKTLPEFVEALRGVAALRLRGEECHGLLPDRQI